MSRGLVVLALLGMVVCARANGSGDTLASFPKKGTGVKKCILPIKNLRCTVDTKSGFVAGVSYGYGPYGEYRVCSTGASSQTTWNMSPTDYRQSIPGFRPFNPEAQNIPKFANGNFIPEVNLMQYGSLITQVIVLHAPNPFGDVRGTIPAILFRYTNEDLASAFYGDTTGVSTIPEPYDWAVCGNRAYAEAYLMPGDPEVPPPPTPVSLKAVYTSPLSEDDHPSFLGGFFGKCNLFLGTSGYLGGDPVKYGSFFLKSLKKVCFTKLAHVVPSKLRDPLPHPPAVGYNWDVPYTPCYWDKKASKKSTSFSCALSGAAVATGKHAAIYVNADGEAIDWEPDEDGKLQQVPFQTLYEGDPEDLAQMALDDEADDDFDEDQDSEQHQDVEQEQAADFEQIAEQEQAAEQEQKQA